MGPGGERTQNFIAEGERGGEPGLEVQTSTLFVHMDSPIDPRLLKDRSSSSP